MRIGSANIKMFLIVFSMGIVVALLFYTQSIVTKLQQRELAIANLVAKAYQEIGTGQDEDNAATVSRLFSFITDEIAWSKDLSNFPIIIADPDHSYYVQKNVPRVMRDSTLTPDEIQVILAEEAKRIGESTPPIVLRYNDTTITQFIYYDESQLVKELRILPYVEILVASLFILVG